MLCYPDYSRSIISVISSIMNYYRVPYEYPTVPALDKHLSNFYKNVVLIVLDGMGHDMLEHDLPSNSFLRSSCVSKLSSVFPSFPRMNTLGSAGRFSSRNFVGR